MDIFSMMLPVLRVIKQLGIICTSWSKAILWRMLFHYPADGASIVNRFFHWVSLFHRVTFFHRVKVFVVATVRIVVKIMDKEKSVQDEGGIVMNFVPIWVIIKYQKKRNWKKNTEARSTQWSTTAKALMMASRVFPCVTKIFHTVDFTFETSCKNHHISNYILFVLFSC